ncbi:MAG: ABC transporter ATP-binding protein [Spirochaetota bacterium]
MPERGEQADVLLEVSSLVKRYRSGGQAVTAVDGISFSAGRGTVLGILGPNGSGKTSTIKAILGLITRDGGTIRVAGHDPAGERRAVLAMSGAVLEGARNIYWRLTVRENVRYFAGLRGLSPKAVRSREEELLTLLGLTDRATARVGTLSRGYQQRCAIACALIHDPAVVFLDEPTLGLDVSSRETIRTSVRDWARGGKLVVITSHDMAFIERSCDRALVMRNGSLVAEGAISSLMSSLAQHTLALTFGERAPELAGFRERWGAFDEDESGRLLVPLDRPDQVYDVLAELGEERLALTHVSVRDNDFESVFVRLLGEEAAERDRAMTPGADR